MNAYNINVSQNSAYKRIKRNLTKVLLIAILSFLTFSSAFAQYKLDLEWQKEPGGNGLNIWGICTQNSDILITCTKNSNETKLGYLIDSLGNIKKEISTQYIFANLHKTNTEGQIFAVSESNLGIIDANSLDYIYKIDNQYPMSGYFGGSYQKVQNKIVVYGKNYIQLYDAEKRVFMKEYSVSLEDATQSSIMKAELTFDGKYIIYCKNDPKKVNGYYVNHYFLKIIDLEGNLVKDFGEVGYKTFSMSIDGKALSYFANKSLQFYDLETKTNQESVYLNGTGAEFFNPTSDGKYLFMGFDGLSMFDLEAKKNISLNKGGWYGITLSEDYKSIYSGTGGKILSKWRVGLNNSVNSATEQSNFSLETNQNEIFVKSLKEINPNLIFSISSADGKESKQFNLNDISLTTTSAILNISELAAGTYFLRIADSQNTLAVLKFLKVN